LEEQKILEKEQKLEEQRKMEEERKKLSDGGAIQTSWARENFILFSPSRWACPPSHI